MRLLDRRLFLAVSLNGAAAASSGAAHAATFEQPDKAGGASADMPKTVES